MESFLPPTDLHDLDAYNFGTREPPAKAPGAGAAPKERTAAAKTSSGRSPGFVVRKEAWRRDEGPMQRDSALARSGTMRSMRLELKASQV